MTQTAKSTKTCDNASVGVLIRGRADTWAFFRRATPPVGIAPVAGHVFDEHAVVVDGVLDEAASYRAAAIAEVREELGLTVTSLTYMTSGWRTAACRRAPGEKGVGHEWRVYQAATTGALNPSERETADVRWYTRDDLHSLARRTVRYAWGVLTDDAWHAAPGIEPVWVRWLMDAGLVYVCDDDLQAIEDLLELRAHRAAHGVPVLITHTLPGGTTQSLWAELADWEQFSRIQDLVLRGSEALIQVRARLHPDGTDYQRILRAADLTITEIER